MRKTYRTRKERELFLKKAAAFTIGFVILCAAVGVVLQLADRKQVSATSSEEDDSELELLEMDGVYYKKKENIQTYLFMGVDSDGEVKKYRREGESGQCDVLRVLVLDRSTGTYQTLSIDRDTITEVKDIDLYGDYTTTSETQIALAHARGNGMEISCENAVDAVSNYLYGQEIDGYLAVNMSAISLLNNLVGGVEVTIEDDFSESDPTLVEGETVTLTDEQAYHFVHDRTNVGDGTNEGRMRRQSAYMQDLEVKLREKCAEDADFPLTLYDSMESYMVTDISRKKFGQLAGKALQGKDDGSVTITGTHTVSEDDGYMEFIPDEDSVKAAVIALFYEEYDE